MTSKIRRQNELKAGHKISIMEDCYIHGRLFDATDCKISLDTPVSKSFMFISLTLSPSWPDLTTFSLSAHK